MSPELQTYYEQRLSMMGDPAWVDLMEDVQQMLDATNSIESIQDEKTLHFRRGEVSMMRWMLSLKQVSEQAYEELKRAPDA
jgi:phage protein U